MKKINKKDLVTGLILTIPSLIVLAFGAGFSLSMDATLTATFIVQLGFAIFWSLAKIGAYKSFFRASKKMSAQKMEKIKSKHNMKHEEEIEESKTWHGVYVMLAIALLEFVAWLIYYLVYFQ